MLQQESSVTAPYVTIWVLHGFLWTTSPTVWLWPSSASCCLLWVWWRATVGWHKSSAAHCLTRASPQPVWKKGTRRWGWSLWWQWFSALVSCHFTSLRPCTWWYVPYLVHRARPGTCFPLFTKVPGRLPAWTASWTPFCSISHSHDTDRAPRGLYLRSQLSGTKSTALCEQRDWTLTEP